MNLGSPDEETLRKSRDALVDELQRCEMLGLTLFNFHPGKVLITIKLSLKFLMDIGIVLLFVELN